jgi:hypothetical protein
VAVIYFHEITSISFFPFIYFHSFIFISNSEDANYFRSLSISRIAAALALTLTVTLALALAHSSSQRNF